MKLLITALMLVSVQSFADIISFTCHPDFTIEQLEAAYEAGEIPEPAGVIDFTYDSGYNTLMIDGREVEISKFRIDEKNWDFIVNTVAAKNNPMAAGQEFVFNQMGEYDFDGTLTVYNTGGFTGRLKTAEMLCLVNAD